MTATVGADHDTPRLPTPAEWTRRAACLAWPDLDWIDPPPGQGAVCVAICLDCPVRRECLAAALVAAEPWGIWGGLDTDQRSELARTTGFPVPNAIPGHGVHSRYLHHGCRCDACRYVHAAYERQRRESKGSAA